jgi:hypothetical protein
MHRVWWDMRYDPIGEGGGRGGATAAVPRRTYPPVNAPWAAPGSYTVRLTVDGKTYAQPIVLQLDPRVKTAAADLALLASLTTEMYDGARAARAAYDTARALSAQLEGTTGEGTAEFKAAIEALAPAAAGGRGGGTGGFAGAAGGRGAGDQATPTLPGASTALLAAAMAMQGAETGPTAREVAACAAARAQQAAVMGRFTELTTTGLSALNAKRKAAGQPEIVIPRR